VVTFTGPQRSQVEDEADLSPLAAALARRVPSTVPVSASPGTPPEETAARLRDVETVVVGSAHAVGRAWQAAAVERLLDAGKWVIGIALSDPFDILTYPRVPVFIAAYSDVPASVEAAAAILFGEQSAMGRLPVQIPGLYPRHHGLRR
jgi:beta-N-acetylhexosaminidase